MKTWKQRLRTVYASLEEFEAYCRVYNLLARLGFKTAKEAWEKNPVIGGSVNPADYGIVRA